MSFNKENRIRFTSYFAHYLHKKDIKEPMKISSFMTIQLSNLNL